MQHLESPREIRADSQTACRKTSTSKVLFLSAHGHNQRELRVCVDAFWEAKQGSTPFGTPKSARERVETDREEKEAED